MQGQLKEKLRGFSRERNREFVREERILSAIRERTEMSLGAAGTNRAEGVMAPRQQMSSDDRTVPQVHGQTWFEEELRVQDQQSVQLQRCQSSCAEPCEG